MSIFLKIVKKKAGQEFSNPVIKERPSDLDELKIWSNALIGVVWDYVVGKDEDEKNNGR
jgi:hypothetical protein